MSCSVYSPQPSTITGERIARLVTDSSRFTLVSWRWWPG
jgi:hypothetical protein